ncbi:MAG: hypothetical protein IKX60_00545 [Bacteroidales bacterium]|nr:hypothetical protein [Bacteroidales bacterium]
MKRLCAYAAIVLLTTSCSLFQSRRDVLARIGKDVLYKNEVEKLVPAGTSPEDSAYMVDQYVQSWALTRLKTLKAQEQLTPEERDISKEIEAFRNDLLSFRYEKMFMESRIDTVVSREQIVEYYETHPESFKYDYSLVRARYIIINVRSPYYSQIKELYRSKDEEKVAELEELSRSYAERYEDYGGRYVSIPQLARDVGMLVSDLEEIAAKQSGYILEGEQKNILICFVSRLAPHTLTPIDYNEEKIKDAIISIRKQEILSKLERDLLNEALENKKLQRYD